MNDEEILIAIIIVLTFIIGAQRTSIDTYKVWMREWEQIARDANATAEKAVKQLIKCRDESRIED